MNRRLLVSVLAVCMGTGIGFASDSGTFALGFQGIGNIYANARPTMRWRKSDATSFDLTPTFSYSDTDKTATTTGAKTSSYGATVGIVKHLAESNGLRIGMLTNLGYTYGYEKLDPAVSSSSNYSYNNYTVSLGLGPDFEYFIPVFPRVSIGAQAIVQYQYIASTNRIVAGSKDKTVPQTAHGYSSTVGLLGEVFTVRYYF